MRIAICGCGVVGRATGEGFFRLGHEVFTYDINPEAARVSWGQRLEHPGSSHGVDVVFFCTPEEAAEEALKAWWGWGIRVVRSSTPPGTVSRLEKELGMPILHNPEWLRESTPLQDFLTPPYILIGASRTPTPEEIRDVESLYRPLQRPIIHTDPTTSEMVKLATNGLLATLIAYWMDIGRLCQELGVSSHQVGMIASLDPRVPAYGARMHHRYGGRCLPKDIQQLVRLARDLGRDVPLLTAAATWAEPA